MKTFIIIFLLTGLSDLNNILLGQSLLDLYNVSSEKYLSMQTICGTVKVTSQKDNVLTRTYKKLYADNRNNPWRLLILPEYQQYIFFDGQRTYVFDQNLKSCYIEKDTLAIRLMASYLDNISSIVLARKGIKGSSNEISSSNETISSKGKGIIEINKTFPDQPEYKISEYKFKMCFDTLNKTPLKAITSYLFLGNEVSEEVALDTVYSNPLESDKILSEIHEMMNTYSLSELTFPTFDVEKEFDYKEVLTKISFINQQPLESKFYLFDFYYVNCPHCLESVPDIKALVMDQLPGTLSVVAINPYDTKERIENYIAKYQIEYPEAIIDKKYALETIGQIGYPYFVLFDQAGNILLRETGFDPAFFDRVRQILVTSK